MRNLILLGGFTAAFTAGLVTSPSRDTTVGTEQVPQYTVEQTLEEMDTAFTLLSRIIYSGNNPENRDVVTVYIQGVGTITRGLGKSYSILPGIRADHDADFDITAQERLAAYTDEEVRALGAVIIQSDTQKAGTWVRFAEYGTIWFPYNLSPAEIELYKTW